MYCCSPLRSFDAVLYFLVTADVLSEEAILKWYTEAHVAKGKSVFLEQMKKFVEWLKNAEEGKDIHTVNIFQSRHLSLTPIEAKV